MNDLSNYRYDGDWREQVELKDGTEVTLRLLRPHDRGLLKKGFDQLSSETRYRRFLGSKASLSETELDYLCDIDNVDHIAIAAIHATTGEGLGVARAVRLKQGGDVAESAVTVIDSFQGKGLGRYLLEHLVRAAVERDIRKFRNTLFAQNKPMRSLIDALGEAEVVEREGPVLTVDAGLPSRAELGMEEEVEKTRPLTRALRMAAEGAFSLVEGLRRRANGSADGNDKDSGDDDDGGEDRRGRGSLTLK